MSMIGAEQYKKFDAYYRTWTRRQRAIRVPLTMLVIFGLTIGLMFVFSGKAFATCSPGSNEQTCPTPGAFQNKLDNGFFDKAAGLPEDKVLTTPAIDKDHFIDKYVTYWSNHPGQRDNMAEHARRIWNDPKTGPRMSKWNAKHPLHQTVLMGTGMKAAKIPVSLRTDPGVFQPHKPITNCQFPLTPRCQAALEWQNMIGPATKCGFWHSYPNTTNKATCDRWRNPVKDGLAKVTKDQWQTSLAITFCSIGAAGTIVAVVTTGGAAAFLAASGATGGCAVALWEAVD